MREYRPSSIKTEAISFGLEISGTEEYLLTQLSDEQRISVFIFERSKIDYRKMQVEDQRRVTERKFDCESMRVSR